MDYAQGDQWLGVRLRPEHGAALWLGDLPSAIDRVVQGAEAVQRLPALRALDGPAVTLATLAQAIASQPWPDVDPRLTRAIDLVHLSGGRLRISAVADFVACSLRHLHRLFRRYVGLCAKTYAQIVQFHRAVTLIASAQVPIIAAAYEGGYADHAHMARNFRRFGGFTPSAIPPDLTLPDIFSK